MINNIFHWGVVLFRLKRTQKTIFDHDICLPAARVEALEKTWAGPFRRLVLPMIDEEPFRRFYCEDNGTPNKPVAILIGACILKEMHNLTDAKVLGSLDFDLRWQYAFAINAFESHVCQKTLHNFRTLITDNEQARNLFTGITDAIIERAALSTEKQRLDSTQIISNMAHLSRLGLFTRTIEAFLKRLHKKHPKLYEKLPGVYDKAYLKRAGYFADVKSSGAKRRLDKSARHLADLVDRFRGHPEISRIKEYRLMARLLSEQCRFIEGDSGKTELKKPKEIPADSLQNPSDPDATYGRKGKGYKASLTETCVKENPFQVITDVDVAPSYASDQKDVTPVIERLEETGRKPGELFADAGYGSGENILQAQEHQVELTAPVTCGKAPDLDKMQLSDFETNEDCTQVVSCIQGHAPRQCKVVGGGKAVEAVFSREHCSICEFLPICPVKRIKGGDYRLKYKRKDMASSKRRVQQESHDFKERYKIRSGIEATISEADRVTGFKRSWTRGKKRVTMSVFMKALAINIKRFVQSRLDKAKEALSKSLEGNNKDNFRRLWSLCPDGNNLRCVPMAA